MPCELAGRAGRLDRDEVRVLRLVDLIAGHQVVAHAEVQRQAVVDAPVVLEVGGELLHRDVRRRVAVADRDQRDRPVHVVGDVGVEHRALAGVEGDEQARLVDEVDADLEVVAEAAQAALVPREVVAELVLLSARSSAACCRWRRSSRRSGSSRWAPSCARRSCCAKSANWKMNSFSFDPPITQLWLRLIELYLLVLSPQLSNVLLGAALYGCEFCRGRSAPTGTGSALRFAVTLPVNGVSRYGTAKTPSCAREQPLGVDRLRLVLVASLDGEEEVRLDPSAIGPPKLPPNWLRR